LETSVSKQEKSEKGGKGERQGENENIEVFIE
jgi:hypothetical protein